MRFAHLSDSHLGARQFGLFDREEDFYEVFERTIDKIIEMDVDFVIHSGDLFDNNRPSTEALLAFQKALLKLNDAKIPIYAIAGNHDSILRKGAMPPLLLFRDLGLKLISQDYPAYAEGPVLICGVPYVASSQSRALKNRLNDLSGYADKYIKSILVSHQGIDKWMYEESYELELEELPKNFDYYAMGHIHNYIEEDFGKGKLVYPGSMEMWRTSECNDNFRKYGKGFVVVDLNESVPKVERVRIDLPRKYYHEVIEYKDLEERLHMINEKIKKLDKGPMLDISVVGGNFDSADVYKVIKETLGEYVLNLRPRFLPVERLDIPYGGSVKTLDPRALLQKKVMDQYGKEEINKLSIDLLDNLSVGKVEDAKIIADRFYMEYYCDGESLKESGTDNSNKSSVDSEGDGNKNTDVIDSKNKFGALDEYLNENLGSSTKDDDDDSINGHDYDESSGNQNANSKQMSFDDF